MPNAQPTVGALSGLRPRIRGLLKWPAGDFIPCTPRSAIIFPAMDTKYAFPLSNCDAIAVRFSTSAGNVRYYVVRLECLINDKKYTVIMFDSSHHRPHKHILKPNGHTKEKIWYDKLSYSEGLTEAIKDLRENYTIYREEFIKWLNEK